MLFWGCVPPSLQHLNPLQFWGQVAQQVVERVARHAAPPVQGGWLFANTVALLGGTSLSSYDKVCRCRWGVLLL